MHFCSFLAYRNHYEGDHQQPLEVRSMSLKDLLKLSDDKLADAFNQKIASPDKARENALKGLSNTMKLFNTNPSAKGRKWFIVKNDVVKFSPPFSVGGRADHYVPSERFGDFVKQLEAAITAGELDAELAAGKEAKAKSDAPKKQRAGWSPERRAAFAAARAAKKG